MSGNSDKSLIDNDQKSDALIKTVSDKQNEMLNELQSMREKMKMLEEQTLLLKESIKLPKKSFVLRHVFKNVSEMAHYTNYDSDHAQYFGALWCIRIRRNEGYISIFLRCDGPKTGAKIETSFNILLSSPDKRRSISKTWDLDCSTKPNSWGWNRFLEFEFLQEEYTVDDEVLVEIRVKVIKTIGNDRNKLRNFDDEELSDVVLAVNGKKFHVSKLFLASQSSYFKALFLGNFEESKKSEIELFGVDENDMQQFLEVLYGEPAVDDMTIEEVLLLSDMYGTKLVTLKCESFLMKDSKKSLEEKLMLSGRYHLEELKQQCLADITSTEHVRSVIHGCPDMHQSILAVLLEKSLSLK